jgi:predicted O-linked N-acetylglucosamine transferase (SPINDLY family)
MAKNVASEFARAVSFYRQAKLGEAQRICRRIILAHPRHVEARHLLGVIRMQQGRFADAAKQIKAALETDPGRFGAWLDLAVSLEHQGNLEEALSCCDRAIALEPRFAPSHCNRAGVLNQLDRPADALASSDKAISLKSDFALAHSNRGNSLFKLKRFEEALASFDAALSLEPRIPQVHNNRGITLTELGRWQEALASYRNALALNPDYPDVHSNIGNVYRQLGRHDEALASYDKAIALLPDYADAHNNRGNILRDLNRLDEALASYRRVLELRADNFNAAVFSMAVADQMCDWRKIGPPRHELIARCRSADFDVQPFPFLAICDEPELHADLARAYVQNKTRSRGAPLWRRSEARSRIRVGYFSADFRQHALSRLLVELIELHDRSRFEIYGISVGKDDGSAIRRRIRAAFDVFLDLESLSDAELARRISEAEIDILVDLGGHTSNGRILALVDRPAPIQASYLGYPGPTGAPFIDYVIADAYVVAAGESQVYLEKVVELPECYQCSDRAREVPEAVPARIIYGLPAAGFVFCCFNNAYKINEQLFDAWMHVLRAVPDSVLWLYAENDWARANLREAAAIRGVGQERVVFAGNVEHSEYLSRLRVADLFLDTWPYNAGTVASDALWVGLPVLTYSGRAFTARMAGSLLHAIGLSELVTSSLSEYETLAAKLATSPAELRALRERLVTSRLSKPLFDTPRFTRHLELAYVTMWEKHTRGENPESFRVKPI